MRRVLLALAVLLAAASTADARPGDRDRSFSQDGLVSQVINGGAVGRAAVAAPDGTVHVLVTDPQGARVVRYDPRGRRTIGPPLLAQPGRMARDARGLWAAVLDPEGTDLLARLDLRGGLSWTRPLARGADDALLDLDVLDDGSVLMLLAPQRHQTLVRVRRFGPRGAPRPRDTAPRRCGSASLQARTGQGAVLTCVRHGRTTLTRLGTDGRVRWSRPVPTTSRTVIDPRGRVLALTERTERWEVRRYGTTGRRDARYGRRGVTRVDLPDSFADPGPLAVDRAGRLLVSARVEGDLGALRIRANGGLDRGFGRRGLARVAFGGDEQLTLGVLAVAGTRRGVVLAGVRTVEERGDLGPSRLAVARLRG